MTESDIEKLFIPDAELVKRYQEQIASQTINMGGLPKVYKKLRILVCLRIIFFVPWLCILFISFFYNKFYNFINRMQFKISMIRRSVKYLRIIMFIDQIKFKISRTRTCVKCHCIIMSFENKAAFFIKLKNGKKKKVYLCYGCFKEVIPDWLDPVRWIACFDCEYGSNRHDKGKCSSDRKAKRFNGLGCFSGKIKK